MRRQYYRTSKCHQARCGATFSQWCTSPPKENSGCLKLWLVLLRRGDRIVFYFHIRLVLIHRRRPFDRSHLWPAASFNTARTNLYSVPNSFALKPPAVFQFSFSRKHVADWSAALAEQELNYIHGPFDASYGKTTAMLAAVKCQLMDEKGQFSDLWRSSGGWRQQVYNRFKAKEAICGLLAYCSHPVHITQGTAHPAVGALYSSSIYLRVNRVRTKAGRRNLQDRVLLYDQNDCLCYL